MKLYLINQNYCKNVKVIIKSIMEEESWILPHQLPYMLTECDRNLRISLIKKYQDLITDQYYKDVKYIFDNPIMHWRFMSKEIFREAMDRDLVEHQLCQFYGGLSYNFVTYKIRKLFK